MEYFEQRTIEFRNRLNQRFFGNTGIAQVDDDRAGITVLSYNVGNGLAPPARLARYLAESDADIIGLQELSVPQAEVIEKLLVEHYPYRLLVPTGFSGKGLLSRLPLLNGTSVSFAPDRPDIDAVVDVDGSPLRVLVAHPRPPKVRFPGVVFDPVTHNQILMVAESAIEGSPSVILGDFNMTERQPQHRLLSASGLIDAFQEVGHRAASFPRRLGHTHRVGPKMGNVPLKPVIRIDYVWYTVELTASSVWVGDDAGSDHLPVLARLHWRAGEVSQEPFNP